MTSECPKVHFVALGFIYETLSKYTRAQANIHTTISLILFFTLFSFLYKKNPMVSPLTRGMRHVGQACECVRWFFLRFSCIHPTYQLIGLDVSEKALKRRKTE